MVAALVVVGMVAWWIVGLPPFSAGATVAVLVAGAAAAFSGARWWRRPAARGGVLPWVVLLAALGVWELAAFLQHPRADHPTLSSLVNALLDSRPARTAAFVAWLVGCAAIARR